MTKYVLSILIPARNEFFLDLGYLSNNDNN